MTYLSTLTKLNKIVGCKAGDTYMNYHSRAKHGPSKGVLGHFH